MNGDGSFGRRNRIQAPNVIVPRQACLKGRAFLSEQRHGVIEYSQCWHVTTRWWDDFIDRSNAKDIQKKRQQSCPEDPRVSAAMLGLNFFAHGRSLRARRQIANRK